jgi:uncharacterized membrane protein
MTRTGTAVSVPVVVMIPPTTQLNRWANEAEAVLASAFGNARRYRESQYAPTLIYSHATIEAVTDETVMTVVRKFVHRLGASTGASEIGVVVGDHYYSITEFDRHAAAG